MIPKAVFGNGHAAGQLEGIGAGLVVDLRVERGEKGVGEFRKTRVGAPDGALPKNEIGDERERHQHHGQHGGVPERETDADGIKHGSSVRENPPWHAAAAKHFRLPRPRLLNRSADQKSSRRRGGYGATACSNRRRFSGARD